MKRFIIKLCTVCAASALLVSSAIPAMAYNTGKSMLDVYNAITNNYEGDECYDEGFWFDGEALDYDNNGEEDTIDHRSAVRTPPCPYIPYLRDYSTPKHISGNDAAGPFWGIDSDSENRYFIMNQGSYWTHDYCIEDAYTLTIDLQLADGLEFADGAFGTTPIANVADKFAGLRLYTNSESATDDVINTTNSVSAPGVSGFGIGFDVADDSKDELVIYVINTDNSITQASFAFDNGSFDNWTTLKITDQLEGFINVYVDGTLTAKITIDGANVAILDAADAEKAATTNANICDVANFHVINANDGDLNMDNIGVKYYEDSDDTEAPVVDDNDTPATEAPATEAPATDAPATDAPVADDNDSPATEAPVVDNDENDTGDIALVYVAVAAAIVVGSIVVIRRKKA